MFERDKDELRSLGVPIEVGQMDAYFDDEPGYRIRPDEFALPDISLTADEAAVVGLATRVWQHARLAEATTEAVRKLTAAGRRRRRRRALDIVEPRLAADEPSFDVFWEATQERHAGRRSTTARSGETEPTDPAPPAVGRRPLLRALVRRRLRHRPRRRAGLPALPGAGRGAQGRRSPAPTTSRPAPTSREVARRLAPEPPTGARRAAGPHGRRRTRCAATPTRVETGVAGPDDAHRVGPAGAHRGARRRSPTRCSATAPTCTSRSPPSCASRSSTRLDRGRWAERA